MAHTPPQVHSQPQPFVCGLGRQPRDAQQGTQAHRSSARHRLQQGDGGDVLATVLRDRHGVNADSSSGSD
jgi:hypothetical protein